MTRKQRKAFTWLTGRLARREELLQVKRKERQRFDEAVKVLQDQRDEVITQADTQIGVIEDELASFFKSRRYWLLRWFSKTIELPSGVITFVQRPALLRLPKDVSLLTEYLDQLPDGEGEPYVRIIKEPNKEALGEAPDAFIANLGRRFGVSRTPYDALRVKTSSEKSSKQIAEWPAKPRALRSSPKKE